MEIKRCNKCGRELPLTDFTLQRQKDCKEGYRRPECKQCGATRSKAWRRRKKEESPEEYQKKYRESNKRWRARHPLKTRLSSLKQRHQCDFTLKELEDWAGTQGNRCYYCSREINWAATPWDGRQATIDRKNSSKHYTFSNIVLCCWRCNAVKGKWLSESKMLKIGKLLDA